MIAGRLYWDGIDDASHGCCTCGNAPSSSGGFVEDRMSASATAAFSSGGMTTSVSYQMELGDELNNSSVDKDYLSANFSYAF